MANYFHRKPCVVTGWTSCPSHQIWSRYDSLKEESGKQYRIVGYRATAEARRFTVRRKRRV